MRYFTEYERPFLFTRRYKDCHYYGGFELLQVQAQIMFRLKCISPLLAELHCYEPQDLNHRKRRKKSQSL